MRFSVLKFFLNIVVNFIIVFFAHGSENIKTYKIDDKLPNNLEKALDEAVEEKMKKSPHLKPESLSENYFGTYYFVKGNIQGYAKGGRLVGAENLLNSMERLPEKYKRKFFIPPQYSYINKNDNTEYIVSPEVPDISLSTLWNIEDAQATGCLALAAKWWDANLGNILKDKKGRLWIVDTEGTPGFIWAAMQQTARLKGTNFEKIVRYVMGRFYHSWAVSQKFDFEYKMYNETSHPIMYGAIPASIILDFTRSKIEKAILPTRLSQYKIGTAERKAAEEKLYAECDEISVKLFESIKEDAEVAGRDLYDSLDEKSATLILNYKYIDQENSISELKQLDNTISQLSPTLQKAIKDKFYGNQ